MKLGFSKPWLAALWLIVLTAPLSAFTYYGPHLTAQAPWISRIDVYNNGGDPGSFTLALWDGQGQLVHQQEYPVAANAVASVVFPADPLYVPADGEIVLDPIEGACTVATASERVRPKLSFRYGSSLSLCEFFMQETLAWEYVLPNPIQAHFIGTGLAVQNPFETALEVRLLAFRQGTLVGDTGTLEIAPRTKRVSISEGFWPGIGADDFDLVRISSSQAAFPTPMSISWDQLQDRHVFFNAAPTALTKPLEAGDLFETDPVLGGLRYVPAGTFVQGSPSSEPCRGADETRFTHVLTRSVAVMETEVTRQMWADVLAAQPTLPVDPTLTGYGAGPDNPVQNLTWYEAVLFANLASVTRGLPRCYWTDAAFTQPLDAFNYTAGVVYCDWTAGGYRLPAEGEWERFGRAGSTTPFWIVEPNYKGSNCSSYITAPGTWPQLESVAWFCANISDPAGSHTSKPVAVKTANPWGLYDTHGNVWEWCWDWNGAYPSGTVSDYTGVPSGSARVRRGGHWNGTARDGRSAGRYDRAPDQRGETTGFRLVRTVP